LDPELENNWRKLLQELAPTFGSDLELEAILFLIGIQELGKGFGKFNKNEKIDLIHVAICTLLTPYGYYEYMGVDEEGWPHWKVNEELPPLKPAQQYLLMKQAIIDYFHNRELSDISNPQTHD
jgi:hypothetical protein